MYHNFKQVFLSLFFLVILGCNGAKSPERTISQPQTKTPLQVIRIIEPTNGDLFALGKPIEINIKQVNNSISPDSIILFIDNNRVGLVEGFTNTLNTELLTLGTRQIRATAWLNGERQTASVGIRLKANKAPKHLKYKVVNTYPHDISAYTHGLFYLKGHLI